MLLRFSLGLITLFWVTMNALLWHSEFMGASDMATAVPLATVWEKVLTAPDDSSLEILQAGRRIGFCQWKANVGEELNTGKVATEELLPEGQVKRLTGYTVDLDGNVTLAEGTARLRFNVHLQLATNQVWQEFSLRASIRPAVWELKAVAREQKITFKADDEAGRWERAYSFSDLRNPQILLREFGAPALLGWLGHWGMTPAGAKPLALGLPWEARNDWLKVGHSQVRAYRLQTRLLDRYQVAIVVSRVGEIMRVELPNQILLVNETVNF